MGGSAKRRWVVLGSLAALLVPAAPGSAQVPPSVSAAFDEVVAGPLYPNSTWGWHVVDTATGETLYERNAGLQFIPGSIIKDYASAAVLARYGSAHRFHTRVHRRGRVRSGTLRGNLVLVGAGDFSFGLRNRPDGTLAFTDFDHNEAGVLPSVGLVNGDPLAGVRALARNVRRAGIRRVTGDVVVDNRLFRPYKGWPDGRVDSIWVNENLIDLAIRPTSRGRRARVSWRPHTAAFRAVSRVTTGPAGSETDISVVQRSERVIEVRGRIAADAGVQRNKFQLPDPAGFARTAFVEALRRAGVRVDARALGPNRARLLPARRRYPKSGRVAEFVSPPLSEYVKVVLKVSYNRGAHLFGCLTAVAAGSRNCNSAAGLMLTTVARLGVSPTSTFLFDTAGSVDDARTTPRDMSLFHASVARQPYGNVIAAGLPVLGRDGSLATTLPDSPAAGHVFAKTGTRAAVTPYSELILNAQNLVGYVDTAGGRRLAFAVMVNDVPLKQFNDVLTVFTDQGKMTAALYAGY